MKQYDISIIIRVIKKGTILFCVSRKRPSKMMAVWCVHTMNKVPIESFCIIKLGRFKVISNNFKSSIDTPYETISIMGKLCPVWPLKRLTFPTYFAPKYKRTIEITIDSISTYLLGNLFKTSISGLLCNKYPNTKYW